MKVELELDEREWELLCEIAAVEYRTPELMMRWLLAQEVRVRKLEPLSERPWVKDVQDLVNTAHTVTMNAQAGALDEALLDSLERAARAVDIKEVGKRGK